MPDVTITVGQRDFTVACQEGEEDYLRTAAKLLDREASSLIGQIGRLPEARMLLMAGLMLADRTAAYQERAEAAEAKLAEAPERPPASDAPALDLTGLAELANRAEALAAKVEDAAR